MHVRFCPEHAPSLLLRGSLHSLDYDARMLPVQNARVVRATPSLLLQIRFHFLKLQLLYLLSSFPFDDSWAIAADSQCIFSAAEFLRPSLKVEVQILHFPYLSSAATYSRASSAAGFSHAYALSPLVLPVLALL